MGKDGTQLLRHCVRLLVLVSNDLLAVRLSGGCTIALFSAHPSPYSSLLAFVPLCLECLSLMQTCLH